MYRVGPKVLLVIWKKEHCLVFVGNIFTLPWFSTSLLSHIMHISAVSVWSIWKSNIKNNHEQLEGQCVAGQSFETMSMSF